MTTRRLAGLLPLCHQGYRRAAGVPYRVATRYDSRMQLDGALAIVTGAAVGTGRAIAERLAAEGARVIVADVDERGGEQTVARIGGERARVVRADLLAPAGGEGPAAAANGPRGLGHNTRGGPGPPP